LPTGLHFSVAILALAGIPDFLDHPTIVCTKPVRSMEISSVKLRQRKLNWARHFTGHKILPQTLDKRMPDLALGQDTGGIPVSLDRRQAFDCDVKIEISNSWSWNENTLSFGDVGILGWNIFRFIFDRGCVADSSKGKFQKAL
jgi:hypothetical protein